MIARRSLRRAVALVATLAIVAAQSAAAAHACMRAGAQPLSVEGAQVCPEHGGRSAGASTGSLDANLCEVHCQDAAAPVAAIPAFAPAPNDQVVVPEPSETTAGLPDTEPDAKGAAPPARSRYCRLQL